MNGDQKDPADGMLVWAQHSIVDFDFAFACHRHRRRELARRTLWAIAACPTQMVTTWYFDGRNIKENADNCRNQVKSTS
jgi:hypothetical protein